MALFIGDPADDTHGKHPLNEEGGGGARVENPGGSVMGVGGEREEPQLPLTEHACVLITPVLGGATQFLNMILPTFTYKYGTDQSLEY